jgi:hypothetical protein
MDSDFDLNDEEDGHLAADASSSSSSSLALSAAAVAAAASPSSQELPVTVAPGLTCNSIAVTTSRSSSSLAPSAAVTTVSSSTFAHPCADEPSRPAVAEGHVAADASLCFFEFLDFPRTITAVAAAVSHSSQEIRLGMPR